MIKVHVLLHRSYLTHAHLSPWLSLLFGLNTAHEGCDMLMKSSHHFVLCSYLIHMEDLL